MKIIFLPYGSLGDVLPFLAVAVRMQSRGHEVIMATNAYFAAMISQAGIRFHEIGTAAEFERVSSRFDDFHPLRSARLFAKDLMLPLLRTQYECIQSLAKGDVLLVNSSLGTGARLAHDAQGLPLITFQLHPMGFWSLHVPPKLGRTPLAADWVPAWIQDLKYRIVTRLFYDQYLLEPTNKFRAELGLQSIRSTAELLFSPQRIIAMFPDWFAPRQPDWPPQVVNTGFPLWDQYDQRDIDPQLAEFLDAGEPPIVFTPGSYIGNAQEFFLVAIDACQRLGRRALLFTRFAQQVPKNLPASILHVNYAPFSKLLPRCGALVSHGGIGTLSAALAAGIPQLIKPMFADQFDNAARLQRLGVGASVWAHQFRAPRVAHLLDSLLASPQVQERCADLASRIRCQDAIGEACDVIESELAAQFQSPDR